MKYFDVTISDFPGIDDHNISLPLDTLTTIDLNYKTRRWLSHLIQDKIDSVESELTGTDLWDVQEYATNLINDMYTVDSVGTFVDIGARIEKTNGQTFPTGALTNVSWNTVIYDTSSFWNVTTPSNLTIPTGEDGKYLITFTLGVNIVNARVVFIILKNAQQLAVDETTGNSYHASSVSTVANCVAGDIIQCAVYTTLVTNAITYQNQAHVSIQRVG